MASDEDLCVHCGNARAWHTALNTNHMFSLDGKLVRLAPTPQPTEAQTAKRNAQVLAKLIGILHNKGLLDDGDLDKLLHG